MRTQPHCKYDHEPDTTCEHCKLYADSYGNTEEDFRNCCFPDCGCDGARNCMVRDPNSGAIAINIETRNFRRNRNQEETMRGNQGDTAKPATKIKDRA